MKLIWFKKHCLICSKIIQDQEFLCRDCNFRLKKFNDPGFMVPEYVDSVYAAWVYDDLSSHLIQRLKFYEDFTVLPFLSESLKSILQQEKVSADVIVPVPLHYSRLFKRGFNQAGEIAKHLAKSMTIPMKDRIVYKCKKTKAQAELHMEDRAKNLRAAFKIQQDCTGMRIALVDDVMTTGSTVNEIAKVLKEAGAMEVHVWALARALKKG